MMSDNPQHLVRNGSHLHQFIKINPGADDVVLLNTPDNHGKNPFSLVSMTTALGTVSNELFCMEHQPSASSPIQ